MRTFVVVVCMLLGAFASVKALDGRDSLSTGRITVGAEEYYLHVVSKGETLYAISRHYNVSQTAIAAANPQIYYGVKEGAILKIPIPNEQRTSLEESGLRIHVVKPGENLYGLSRQYGVPVARLREFNSLLSDTLQTHQLLRIPPATSAPERVYEVQKGEGVYGIAKRLGVTQEQLLEANPWLRERALAVGDKLVVPHLEQLVPDSSPVHEGGQAALQPSVMCDSSNAFPRWKTLHVALVLPFELGKTAISENEEEGYDLVVSTSSRGIAANTRYLDFYQGVLFALNDFRLKGCNISLSVFDSQHSTAVVQKLVQSDTLRNADLIIGPVHPKNITLLSQYAAQKRIPIISPLSGKTPALDLNPYLFQANPSFYTQLKSLVQEVLVSGMSKVLVIREESIADADMADRLTSLLQEQAKLLTPSPEIKVLTYPKGEATAKLTPRLRSLIGGTKNLKIFIPSNSEPFVSDILGQLNGLFVLKVADSVDVYGMPRWFKMRNLDLSQLGSIRVTLFSPYYVDYLSEPVYMFLESYREIYRTEPSQYAFQGYDVAKFFLSAIYRYGEDFRHCLPYCDEPLLQTRFDFRAAQEFGSYESRAIYLLQFDLERGLLPIK